ncbi:MAG TPA: hypothetical protein PKA00_13215 [Saprospiraceae bacterium]|nr:hypothetical protein [Saprospiraceae bacterium]HMQ83868.1 hypothetical protein [Saprospiraceae bacterium]
MVIKKSSQVKASAVVGQTISIKTADGYSIIGTLNDIQETYLTIDQTQIPISAIVWIKIRNKHKNITTTILKWIGIAAGIALLGFISFAVIFAIAYAGGSGTSFLIGLLLLSGLFYLFLKIVSRKKYRLSKYDLEIQ